MKQSIFTIQENVEIAKNIFRMVLEGDTNGVTAPGQFVNIRLAGKFLRRPISIADWDEKTITLLYKVVGSGTDEMAQMRRGEYLDLLTGLGNGFSVLNLGKTLLVGGGIGLAPLYGLAKRCEGGNVTVVIGAARKEELFYVDEFKALGAKVVISTDDGSEGIKGFVTDAIRTLNDEFDALYCCGPMPMMKAVYKLCDNMTVAAQFSLEERMGCGFGACVGCSVEVKGGISKRVCKDGPVFRKEELIW